MREKFDRVLLVPGDTPLFLPKTIEALLGITANISVPECKHVNGYPVLLDKTAMNAVLAENSMKAAENAVRKCNLRVESIRVEDSGIMFRGSDMSHRKLLIQNHNSQLARPVTEVTLRNGGPLYDPRLSMLLNHVEDKLGYPLVTRIRGGSTGSGSVLTEKGRALMGAYDQFSEHLNRTARELYEKIFSPLPEFH